MGEAFSGHGADVLLLQEVIWAPSGLLEKHVFPKGAQHAVTDNWQVGLPGTGVGPISFLTLLSTLKSCPEDGCMHNTVLIFRCCMVNKWNS